MKDLLAEKLLGEVHEFNATYDRYRPEAIPGAWREADLPGSGILYDLGPHLLDQVLDLFGNPTTITADIRLQRPHSKVDDYFNIWLDFGFLKAILHAGMLVREQGPRYMIQGTKGSFIKYGEDPQEVKLKAGELPTASDWGKESEEYNGVLHTEINGEVVRKTIPSHKGNYGLYYKSVYNSIVNNAPVTERPEHGHNTIRLINLAFESSRQKKTLDCTGLL
jgi:predicted dehydrogenase